MSDDDQEHRFALVMPFVVCRSRGGPYDDTAFVAGYRLGRLEERLSTRMLGEHQATLAPDDVRQADLIAMRHGYTLTVDRTDGAWCKADFRRIPMAATATPG